MPRRYPFDPFDPFGRREDEHWVDPTRTDSKETHPYSYSEFYLYGGPAGRKASTDAVYSDRLWQWDHDKTERLWKEHCAGHRYDNVPINKLSAFMSAWQGHPVEVTALAEGCNISNGYPYWIIWYRAPKP